MSERPGFESRHLGSLLLPGRVNHESKDPSRARDQQRQQAPENVTQQVERAKGFGGIDFRGHAQLNCDSQTPGSDRGNAAVITEARHVHAVVAVMAVATNFVNG